MVEVDVALVGFREISSLPFPFPSVAFDLLLVTLLVTSPRASRFLFPCVASTTLRETVEAVLDAAVGFERVTILDGRALAFSLSFATARVARVTRRVCIEVRTTDHGSSRTTHRYVG